MHLRLQMFQTDVFGQLCSPQSICDNQECSHVLLFCKSSCGICSVHILESRMCQTGFPNVQECVLARRLSIQMLKNVLSLDACRPKCVSYVLKCALARRLSIKTRFLYDQMRSRSTPVNPNAFPMCSNVLSLDACKSKCVSYVLKCVLARSLSIQMRLALGMCTWIRKLLNQDLDRKVSN